MEMNSALVPYLLSSAGSTASIRSPEINPAQAFNSRPETGNIAFYFRNWPFPVDLTEQAGSGKEMRSWQEKLANYREASRAAIRENLREEGGPEQVTEETSEQVAIQAGQTNDDQGGTVQISPDHAADKNKARGPKSGVVGMDGSRSGPDDMPLSSA